MWPSRGTPMASVISARALRLFSKSFGEGSVFDWTAVFVDQSGNAIISGEFQGAADFGAGPVASAGGVDIFVAKYTQNGTLAWGRTFGDAENQVARSIAVGASGDVGMCGYFAGVVDFGSGPQVAADGTEIYLTLLPP